MKLGSLFDGSGGFPLAGALCGITPVWASEVEPYPIAVTRSRFPEMRHLGDVSKVSGADIEPVDVITFGSTCQDLSVAGKRAGLKHTENGDEETTRSGLFMEAVRIIKEMRGKSGGIYPAFAVWENVPGAFSSNKGEDFKIVLEELIRIAEPEAPPLPAPGKNGWPYADCIVGDGWSVAWRVFDAQYWGVPQRRRRIYLVADFRGERAGKVLFEREGLRGYFAEGRTPWKAASAHAGGSPAAADREGELILNDQGGQQMSVDFGVCPTLRAEAHGNLPCVLSTAYSFDSLASNSMKSKNPHSGCRAVEIAKTLDTTYPDPSKNQGGIAIVQVCYDARGNGDGKTAPTITCDHNNRVTDYTALTLEPVYCLQGNGIDRSETAGCDGKGWKEDVCYTLNTIDRPAVAYAMQGFGDYKESDAANGLKVRDYKGATDLVLECAGIDCRNMNEYPELYPTLQAKPNGGQSLNFSGAVRIWYIVRRLTPTECARLQGFADEWGVPDHKDDFSDAECRFWQEVRDTYAEINGNPQKQYTKAQLLKWYNGLYTDSAEYKMWGNGIALPTALYVMQGIEEALRED